MFLEMDVSWAVTAADLSAVQTLLAATSEAPLVLERQELLLRSPPTFDPDDFWHRLVSSILSSVTSSGAGGKLDTFVRVKPFPLALSTCKTLLATAAPKEAITALLRSNGIGKNVRRSSYLVKNLDSLEGGGWADAEKHWSNLEAAWGAESEVAGGVERAAAHWADEFYGVGPKQSRNLWQWLGLTRFEFPIDSRWMKWLREEIRFPLPLDTSLFSSREYYELVQGRIQELAAGTAALPVILDAAVFSLYER